MFPLRRGNETPRRAPHQPLRPPIPVRSRLLERNDATLDVVVRVALVLVHRLHRGHLLLRPLGPLRHARACDILVLVAAVPVVRGTPALQRAHVRGGHHRRHAFHLETGFALRRLRHGDADIRLARDFCGERGGALLRIRPRAMRLRRAVEREVRLGARLPEDRRAPALDGARQSGRAGIVLVRRQEAPQRVLRLRLILRVAARGGDPLDQHAPQGFAVAHHVLLGEDALHVPRVDGPRPHAPHDGEAERDALLLDVDETA